MSYRKHEPTKSAGDWEVAGLDWLRAAAGAEVVQVLGRHGDDLELQRLDPVTATSAAAAEFGRALAATHRAGGEAFGLGPPTWTGSGWQGPADALIPLDLGRYDHWGSMYAELRIAPLVAMAGEALGIPARSDFDRLCQRLADGDFDTGDPPARVHGDLWSGNVMWTTAGCVLIDPMAHTSHREVDLAALALFGCPELASIIAAYDDAWPLADGWRDRVELMQLHLVLLHVVLFGGGYVSQAAAIARRYR